MILEVVNLWTPDMPRWASLEGRASARTAAPSQLGIPSCRSAWTRRPKERLTIDSSSNVPSLTSDPMPTVMSLSRRTLPMRPSRRSSL